RRTGRPLGAVGQPGGGGGDCMGHLTGRYAGVAFHRRQGDGIAPLAGARNDRTGSVPARRRRLRLQRVSGYVGVIVSEFGTITTPDLKVAPGWPTKQARADRLSNEANCACSRLKRFSSHPSWML